MTTQAQGKGRKKNKEVMKLSLDEFNNIDAPHGHSVVSLKMTGLDWAETMADYDQKASETQQIIVPTAPRAQRGPDVDYDSLPNEPPFKVSIFNLPMSVEEKELCERFFQGIEVVNVEITKMQTTAEFASKDAMYEALCKDGTSIKGRTINVLPYGRTPQSSGGYGERYGRGGNSYEDRYGDRNQNSYGAAARSGDRFGDRSTGGFNRERDNYNNRAGGAGFTERYQPRSSNMRGQYTSGGGEPSESEEINWRSRPAVKPLQTYTQSRFETSQQEGSSGGFNRDRDSYGGFNRSGFVSQSRAGGYNDRYQARNNPRGRYTSGGGEPSESDEQLNWRARPAPTRPLTEATHKATEFNQQSADHTNQ